MNNLSSDMLKGLYDTVMSTKDFVLAQAPDVLKQVIAFNKVEDIVSIVITLLVIGIAPFVWKKAYNSESEVVQALGCTGSVLASIISLCFFCASTYDLIELTFAPKVYLIQYLATLILHH